MKIKHILVPIDFSECSINALKEAAKIARKLNSKIYLLHSSHISAPYVSMGEPVMDTFPAEYGKEIEGAFKKLEEEVPLLREIQYETKEVINNLMDSIYTEITASQIDIVIMGTRKDHDFFEKMLGSHASDVLKIARVPVLIIPDCTEKFDVKKIGIGVDAKSIKEVDKIDAIAHIAHIFDAEINVFYVAKPGETLDFANSSYKDIFESYFQGLNIQFINVKNENTLKGIEEFSHNENIDLLVLFPRHHELMDRILHGSTTQKIVKKMDMPLLAIPE